jgi:serine/threonine protein kinase
MTSYTRRVHCPHCSQPISSDTRFCGGCGLAISGTSPLTEHGNPVPVDVMIGREVAGRYRILAKIGEGGMGAVFRAEQISLKRTVALKLLKPDLVATPVLLRRFNAEAEAVAKLNHPNTVGIYDFGQDTDGALFIAMEYIEGRSLRSALTKEGPMHPARAVYIATQVASSLADAHHSGVVHRDLKPDNVMLQDKGKFRDVVRVLDFGIAKLRDDNRATAMTAAGDVLGTPQYMAPEQIRGETIDGRTDVYALSAMLYEMITGRMVFEATTVLAILSKHLTDIPQAPSQRRPDLGLPPAIDELLLAGLVKQPAQRIASMEAMMERLAAVAGHLAGNSSVAPSSQMPSPVHTVGASVTPVPTAPTSSPYAPGTVRNTPYQPQAGGGSPEQIARTQVVSRQAEHPIRPRGSSAKAAIIGGVIASVLAASGGGAYWFFNKKPTNAQNAIGAGSNDSVGSKPDPWDKATKPADVEAPPTVDPWAPQDQTLPVAPLDTDDDSSTDSPDMLDGVDGKLYSSSEFNFMVPNGFAGPTTQNIGPGVAHAWVSSTRMTGVLVIVTPGNDLASVTDYEAELRKVAKANNFEYINHEMKKIAGQDRVLAAFRIPKKNSGIGVDARADAVFYVTPTHTLSVFVMYPENKMSQTENFRNQVFNGRISW